MPKPVLSDSLFNANDVATAILDSAELSVTNQDFAVADRSSEFTIDSFWTSALYSNFYSFNGFMFVNFYVYRSGSGPSHGQVIYSVSSSFAPNSVYSFNTSSHEGDTAEHIKFTTNGDFEVHNPDNEGSNSYYVVVNGWYRFT
tara:strand:- start:271 stop:699 length:429 start_codon:yes stop_codon:yes gene_type:complete